MCVYIHTYTHYVYMYIYIYIYIMCVFLVHVFQRVIISCRTLIILLTLYVLYCSFALCVFSFSFYHIYC